MLKKILPLIVLAMLLLTGCGDQPASPPLIYLTADGALVDGFQGSYCWDRGRKDIMCKDTMAPYFEGTTYLSANDPLRLQLDTPLPNEVTLVISREVFGEPTDSTIMPPAEIIEWSPMVAPGEYILAVHAEWKQGVVSYWFSISLD